MSENKKILNAEIMKKESEQVEKIRKIFEGIYVIFYYILKDPFDNFWWECFSLVTQYSQLIIFIFDETVSNNFYIIVLEYFSTKYYSKKIEKYFSLFAFYSSIER